ncbi:MAG: response regulator [Butyrivibrio sp.]|uniref:Stage 0 sporulation protein A homolog n=1 Tax=Butyrivibrio hungatei TaxID=185008 RepID=A0A1G5FR86_9FIRM|nr:HD domain-containing phosphohydrolase [Butyrivibrio hungatei]MBQ2609237.1 response regulator [Butyrivibrio sp.]MBQ4218092.1 response regulator [Butyrivibrio sp.]MBR4670209.1 response regulator [Butyrivibrio sp.]MEE3471058.1 HD domain-containing phosphohydrolase [Butyrivibrio hungatei]SCY41746.1 putative two-component system response regulator [Butyrivibrio hungatei]
MADRSIMLVDDNDINRGILAEIFKDKYNIIEASDGSEAVRLINQESSKLAAILLDVIMPGMDGYAVLEAMVNHDNLNERIPVLMITADTSTEAERTSYEKGAADVIHKPFDPVIVDRRVSKAIELYDHKNNLETKVDDQTRILKKQFIYLKKQEERLRYSNEKVIDTIATIIEFRNMESGYHLKRIKGFVRILALTAMNNYPEMGLTPHMIEVLTQASAMHDVGKISVPDSILLKPGRLTSEEFEVMKSHTTRGCEIIEKLKDIQDKEYYEACLDICRHHHERYDGRGYPDGLKGEENSIGAQLTAIADVYDALVSDRVYKSAYPVDKAYEMIKNGECGVFSPKLLACFEFARPDMEKLVAQTKAAEAAEKNSYSPYGS